MQLDETEWRGLSDNHRIASNTASFSFVTSMEGVVQDISDLSTTPATYSSLFSGLGVESRVSGRQGAMPGDDPHMDALSRILRKCPTTSASSCFSKKQEPFSYYRALSSILSKSSHEESFLSRPDRSRKEVSTTDQRAY